MILISLKYKPIRKIVFLTFIIFSIFNSDVFSSEATELSAADKPIVSKEYFESVPKFPDEIWITIMSHNNPRAREWRVCKHLCGIFDNFVISNPNKHIFNASNQISLSFFLKKNMTIFPNVPLISLSIYMTIDDSSFLNDLTDLKRLELCTNIKVLPATIEKLLQLQRLTLGGKNFENPSQGNHAIGRLTKLQSLSLIDNNLACSASHTSLTSLADLTYLNVKDNDLDNDALNTFATLTNLRQLDISENKLTSLEKLSVLTNLVTLNLLDTNIQMENLEYLIPFVKMRNLMMPR